MKLISAIQMALVTLITVLGCIYVFRWFDTTLLGVWLAFDMLVFIFYVALREK